VRLRQRLRGAARVRHHKQSQAPRRQGDRGGLRAGAARHRGVPQVREGWARRREAVHLRDDGASRRPRWPRDRERSRRARASLGPLARQQHAQDGRVGVEEGVGADSGRVGARRINGRGACDAAAGAVVVQEDPPRLLGDAASGGLWEGRGGWVLLFVSLEGPWVP